MTLEGKTIVVTGAFGAIGAAVAEAAAGRGASVAALDGGDASVTVGSYYTGITRRSVEERVSEHAQGLMPGYAFTRRPVKLVFSEHYEWIVDAIAAERRIKGWSRTKKEAYMNGDFATLVAISKRGPRTGG